MMFHDIPRCSTTFHDVPRHSTMFHDIPRCSATSTTRDTQRHPTTYTRPHFYERCHLSMSADICR
ncbi:hypothetical protein BD777DRAFT_14931 [Yarrowia lipolytica]|nr:hypothetical protein BD777DRAFT_14931 [Yarrowia lipolytica]